MQLRRLYQFALLLSVGSAGYCSSSSSIWLDPIPTPSVGQRILSSPPNQGGGKAQMLPETVVRLQNSTPGTQQSGHFNISGTGIAGFFKGNGSLLTNLDAATLSGQAGSFYQDASNLNTGTLADGRLSTNVVLLNNAQTISGAKTFTTAPGFTAGGAPFTVSSSTKVTNLNADLIDGLDSSAFLQSIPVPLTLSGTEVAHILKGTNASTAVLSRGLHGASTGATGATIGVLGENLSTSGTGVAGLASAATGITVGVTGQSDSTSGRGVSGVATAGTGTTYGGRFESASTSGRGVYAQATAGTGATYGVWGASASTTGYGVRGTATAASGTNYGVFGESDSTGGIGVYGEASAASGTTYGGWFQNASPTGRGVYGFASDTTAAGNYGVYGESAGNAGIGVFGRVTHSQGITHGGWFESASSGGMGILAQATSDTGTTYGGYFYSASSSGRAIYGLNNSRTGTTYGGYFVADSTSGIAVYGHATSTSGGTYAGLFENDSTSGAGVRGVCNGTVGLNYGGIFRNESDAGRGVYGYANNTSGTNYGVRRQTQSSSGYGVYSVGDMGASGTKSFRIDHPSDPENKYLLHYSAESPEVINFYSGKITLNARGEAVVELPPYFASINKDPRYTLTAVGAPMPMLHVAEEISEQALRAGEQAGPGIAPPVCSFRIAGGVPGAKVSWEVKALRNDLRLRLHGAPAERQKSDYERGKYQHPEYYGLGPELQMDYDATADGRSQTVKERQRGK